MSYDVRPLRGGHEDYVLRSVANGGEDYAAGTGEARGEWLGGGAADLGLAGEVTPDALMSVLGGRDPATGERVVHAHKRPGWEATFSPAKSVSVLWALGGEDVGRIVEDAHREAVSAALTYLESQAATVGQHPRGKHGPLVIAPSSGLVAARFDHRTSRSGDMQLHSHVVIANMGHADGDRWRAIGHSGDLWWHGKVGAGDLYDCELRRLLSERLGVAWTDGEHPEIVGVSPELIDHFSSRTKEALEHLAKRGTEATPEAMHVAILATRSAKPAHVDSPGRGKVAWSPNAGDYGVEPSTTEGLHDRWRRETLEAGLTFALDEIVMRSEPVAVDYEAVRRLGAELAGPNGLTANSATFRKQDVVRAFARGVPGISADEAVRLADTWLASEMVVANNVRGQGKTAPTWYTTRDLLAQEESLLRSAEERLDAGVGVVDGAVVDAVVAGRGLSAEQEAMVRSLTSSGAGVELVVGRAGTGKTFALDAAREAWEAAGHTVIGTATSAAAAGQLRRGARMEATTVARQILNAHRDGLPAGCVLVVDESAMVDTRSLAALARAVEAAHGKLVLVGDHHQLGAVGAGGAFAHLVERIGACELTEVRRQESVEDRENLAELRHGDVTAGVRGLLSRVGRTTMADSPDAQRAAMAADFCAARSAGHSVLLLARRRKQVEALAVAVRDRRKAAGELGNEELTVPITVPGGTGVDRRWQPPLRTFSAGDEVLFAQNVTGRWKHLKESLPGVHNGAGAVVTAVDVEAGTVTVKLDTSPDEAQQWEALAAKRDREIADLEAEMSGWAQRRDEATTPSERATAERRRQATEVKVRRRLEDREAGVVAVPGRGKLPRPGHEVVVPSEYLQAGNLALGYARTIHKVQGATADVCLVDGDDVSGREAAYVAMSRHKKDVRVYLTASTAPDAVETETVGRTTPVDRLIARASKSEAQRTATETLGRDAVARRRRQRALAAKPLGELTAEMSEVEAELSVAARRWAPAGRTVEDPVAVARAEVDAAEARAAETGDQRDAHQAWLARQRLQQERARAARRPVSRAASAPDDAAVAAKVARLVDLRQAVQTQTRLAVEALAAEGGGGLGPRPAQGPERTAWEQAAAAAITYTARWGVQPTTELGRDAPAEQQREAERLDELLKRRTAQQQVERERGVSA